MKRWLDNIFLDLRYAMRAYRHSPGFTITALIAIAVGIGATSAVFSITDRILFRHLPYQADEQLMSLGIVSVLADGEFLFAPDFKMLKDANTLFQSMTSWSGVDDCDITEQNPLRQRCAQIDSNFLDVFRPSPIAGRRFIIASARPNARKTVMLIFTTP